MEFEGPVLSGLFSSLERKRPTVVEEIQPQQQVVKKTSTNNFQYNAAPVAIGTVETSRVLDLTAERFVLFPITYQAIWTDYKALESDKARLWHEDDFTYDFDVSDFKNLGSQKYRDYVLYSMWSLLSVDDTNLLLGLMNLIQIPEVKCLLGFQNMKQGIYRCAFSNIISQLIEEVIQKGKMIDENNLDELYANQEQIYSVYKVNKSASDADVKLDRQNFFNYFAEYAIQSKLRLATVFLTFESWSAKYPLLFKSIRETLDNIKSETRIVNNFACRFISAMVEKPDEQFVKDALQRYIQAELAIIDRNPFLNREELIQFMQFLADQLLVDIGMKAIYNVHYPFPWSTFAKRDDTQNNAPITRSSDKISKSALSRTFSTEADF